MNSRTSNASNPLLGAAASNINDSFGLNQPALLVPSPASPASGSQENVSGGGQSGAAAAAPPLPPPPVMSIAPPPAGIFLLPSSSSAAPPSSSMSLSGARPRSRYVPPPGIQSSQPAANMMPTSQSSPDFASSSFPPQFGADPFSGSLMQPSSSVGQHGDPFSGSLMQPSTDLPPVTSTAAAAVATSEMYAGHGNQPMSQFVPYQGPELYPGQAEKQKKKKTRPPPVDNRPDSEIPKFKAPDVPFYHWYYKEVEYDSNFYNPRCPPKATYETWKPFSMRDSMALEFLYGLNKDTDVLIPTDGGRYDVHMKKRVKMPVYWKDGLNDKMAVRRASWFYKSNLGSWVPYDEDLAAKLEEEYQLCLSTGEWRKEVRVTTTGESIRMISQNMIFHFPTELSALDGKLDEWGQVQPMQDPDMLAREVHRSIEGILDDIPDGENMAVDHLVFVVHGIGEACDMKMRPIHEVVDSYRELTHSMSHKHFQNAHLQEKVSRVEFLPVNWHKTLHGEDTGTDERLHPLTLKSIPKLRNFVNDTLLDILFYTSPIYCQTILDTVVSEINSMYALFLERNDDFKGKVSIMGHSLGSLICFDILSHQISSRNEENKEVQEEQVAKEEHDVQLMEKKPANENELTLEQVFAQLGIAEYAEKFTKEGIDMEALLLCTEDDLKDEGGLPLGPRKKLMQYLESRKAGQKKLLSGLEAFQRASVTEDIKYVVGPAGTGQPSVKYPRLDFEPASFYALGSPIALFHAVRGISNLGSDFRLPTCPKFFNIFHPYDPVAYRIETLVDHANADLRPVVIPHHAGRKRMHLELKETVTKLMTGDIKKKVIDSMWATLGAIYNTATGASSSYDAEINEAVQQKLEEEDQLDSSNPRTLDSRLNMGQRIDYALQEAPYESFNEYVFALGSHLCYWESEDTSLMVLKDIYSVLGLISDDQLDNNSTVDSSVPYLNAASHPPSLTPAPPTAASASTPTAILAPPPTPIGGPMTGPPVPVLMGDNSGESSFLNAPAFPASRFAPPSTSSLGPPLPAAAAPALSSPQQPSTATSSPMMMPPLNAAGPPPTTASSSSSTSSGFKPKRVAYPTSPATVQQQTAMGMDPTAPVSADSRPIGPPPMAGFTRKS